MSPARNILRSQTGFTLMEILVVLVIVAIVAFTVWSYILPGVLIRVRDTIRLSDLDILSRALASYSTDKGFYPPSTNQLISPWTCALTISSYNDCLTLRQEEMAPYLSKPIFDPLDKEIPGGNIDCTSSPCYMYGTAPNDHVSYCICAQLEGFPPQEKTGFCKTLVPYGNYCLTNTSN